MGDLRARVEGTGWSYTECDGNNPDQVLQALEAARATSAPSFIYASTVKGSGIPWMEQFPDQGEYYKFHSGALAPELYSAAVEHLVSLIPGASPQTESASVDPARPEFDAFTPRSRPETLLTLWEDMLPALMEKNPNLLPSTATSVTTREPISLDTLSLSAISRPALRNKTWCRWLAPWLCQGSGPSCTALPRSLR